MRETEKQRGRTSPSKGYANREQTADFLLEEASIKSDSKSPEVGLELPGRLEDNSRHPKASGRLRVGGNVVNVNRFGSPDFTGAKGLAINNRVGLADADAVRIVTVGKKAEAWEARLHFGHQDLIGV